MNTINFVLKKKILGIFLLIFFSEIHLFAQNFDEKWVIANKKGCKVLEPLFSERVTVEWDGRCVDGKANGFGKLIRYQDGKLESTYEGEYEKGIRHGTGKFIAKDGTVSSGHFIQGQLMGLGTQIDLEGNKYEGNFFHYQKHGWGKMVWPDGTIYEGFWVSNRLNTGKIILKNGEVLYCQNHQLVKKIKESKNNYHPETGVKVTEYFDANMNRCTQKKAAYYREVTYETQNKPRGTVKDYYITGELVAEFSAIYLDYQDEGRNFLHGVKTVYYRNGRVKSTRRMVNNLLDGKRLTYFENGKKYKEENFSQGELDGPYFVWDQSEMLKYEGIFDRGQLLQNKYLVHEDDLSGFLDYEEPFEKNEKQWAYEYEKSISEITSDGNVLLTLKDQNAVGTRSNVIDFQQNKNFQINALFQKKSGKESVKFGLIFGFADFSNYLQFLISEDGYFTVIGMVNSNEITLCGSSFSSAIHSKGQKNSLEVRRLGNDFIFSINNQEVIRTKAVSLVPGSCGIAAYGKGSYVFSQLNVKEYLTPEEMVDNPLKKLKKPEEQWLGNGTGFFISSKGYIATNYHVVKGAKEIQVEFIQKGNKSSCQAKVVSTDKENDVAIIKIDDANFKKLPNIPYGINTSTKDVGTEVFALGYPLIDMMGAEIKFTDGKISSKSGFRGDEKMYQISVPIQPGNSGGPLFDTKGNLIGITSSGLNKETTENVNYAIKIQYLKNLMDSLPEKIIMQNSNEISKLTLPEKIKIISDFVPLIKVR
jgi:S1-C subfamily serine protease/antitoxin component YwqK of YwqJK toxin-antitoxin module